MIFGDAKQTTRVWRPGQAVRGVRDDAVALCGHSGPVNGENMKSWLDRCCTRCTLKHVLYQWLLDPAFQAWPTRAGA